MYVRHVGFAAYTFGVITVQAVDELVSNLMAAIGKPLDPNTTRLSLENNGNAVVRVDNVGTGGNSFQLQPGNAIIIEVTYTEAQNIHVSTAAGAGTSEVNVQCEGNRL